MNTGKSISFIILVILIVFAVPITSQDCSDRNYIIPTAPLDSAFDSSFTSMRSSGQLRELIVDPNSQNIKHYVQSVAPASGPLFALGILTFVLFWICLFQICCFQLCKVKACGNEINSNTYSPCCIRILGVLFGTFSLLLILACIAAIILNNGLIAATRKSHCNANNIATQLFEGNQNNTIPWSGVNNFDEYIQDSTLGLQNTFTFLQQYFSSQNANYNSITDNTINSLYYNTTRYPDPAVCKNGNTPLSCPFSDATKCPNSAPKAVFNEQFCNISITTSSAYQINQQIIANQTTWKTALMNLSNLLSTMTVTQQSVMNVTNGIVNISKDVSKYQNDVEDGFTTSDKSILGIEIALYVLYGLLLFFTIIGLLTFCAAYCMRFFKMRCCMYSCWVIFMLFGTAIFLLSGILLSFSIFSFDICSAYGFYFSSEANFKELKFNSYSVGTVIENCFFQNDTTFFQALDNSTIAQQMANLDTYYNNALPNNSFSSVVSNIEMELNDYLNNPQNVKFVGQNNSNSALAALQAANLFANYSASGSNQTCQVTQDKIVFWASNCTPYSTEAIPPLSSCITLFDDGNPNYLDIRKTKFVQKGSSCTNQQNQYVDNFQALQNYGNSLSTLVQQLYTTDTSSSTPLLQYEQAYFQYWSTVYNFMTTDRAQLFYAFDEPFTKLNEGASCGFIETSIRGLFTVTCNETFAYLYGFSIINIIISCILFFLMIFAFYLAPRLAFVEYIDGDYENIGGLDSERSHQQQSKNIQMRNTLDLKQPNEFLTSTDRRNI